MHILHICKLGSKSVDCSHKRGLNINDLHCLVKVGGGQRKTSCAFHSCSYIFVFKMRTTTTETCVLFGANVKDIHDHDHDSYQAGMSLTELGHELDRIWFAWHWRALLQSLMATKSWCDGDQEESRVMADAEQEGWDWQACVLTRLVETGYSREGRRSTLLWYVVDCTTWWNNLITTDRLQEGRRGVKESPLPG